MAAAAQARPDPRRYFEAVGDGRGPIAEQEPVCLYLETTNRCNLLCETCPRTFEDLEPPADMSWELFTRIVDQFPQIARVVLHGVGEPMMVKALPRMVQYLKDARRLRVVQHQRHLADRAQGPGIDRSRPRRIARLARRRRAARLSRGARQGHVCQDRAQRAGVRRTAARRRDRPAAGLAVADRAQGDDRPAAGVCPARAPDRRRRSPSSAPRLHAARAGVGARPVGAVRKARRRGGRSGWRKPTASPPHSASASTPLARPSPARASNARRRISRGRSAGGPGH